MNPIAQELNDKLKSQYPQAFDMLSETGKALYMPKGIVTQSAEAQKQAHTYNATIGMAKEQGDWMHLAMADQFFDKLSFSEIYPYAPTGGIPPLRQAWQKELIKKNPSLQGKSISLPLVTCGITNGLRTAAHLFLNPGDILVLPDKLWGNYKLIFSVLHGVKLKTFPFYTRDKNGFNHEGYAKALQEAAQGQDKVVSLLNFPNNPTGYSLKRWEAEAIKGHLLRLADKPINHVLICDDSYFGLFYEDTVFPESLFATITGEKENLLTVKLCGATKENFSWGFRVGFLSFGLAGKGDMAQGYEVLTKKAMGCIRGTISNANHAAQSITLKIIEDPSYEKQKQGRLLVLKERAQEVKTLLQDKKFAPFFTPYAFNAGYFMCIELKKPLAERLRRHLLDRYGIGTISTESTDLRIAFSCVEKEKLRDLFDKIYQGCKEIWE